MNCFLEVVLLFHVQEVTVQSMLRTQEGTVPTTAAVIWTTHAMGRCLILLEASTVSLIRISPIIWLQLEYYQQVSCLSFLFALILLFFSCFNTKAWWLHVDLLVVSLCFNDHCFSAHAHFISSDFRWDIVRVCGAKTPLWYHYVLKTPLLFSDHTSRWWSQRYVTPAQLFNLFFNHANYFDLMTLRWPIKPCKIMTFQKKVLTLSNWLVNSRSLGQNNLHNWETSWTANAGVT